MYSFQIRRDFIQKSTVAAGGVVALSALNHVRAAEANDWIRLGVIGVGGMGTGYTGSLVRKSAEENIQVVAVSDFYQRRLNRGKGSCQGDGYPDYRRLLERKDTDAVLIATPDHWQARIALDALEPGKHVSCEKPLTHTVEQSKVPGSVGTSSEPVRALQQHHRRRNTEY